VFRISEQTTPPREDAPRLAKEEGTASEYSSPKADLRQPFAPPRLPRCNVWTAAFGCPAKRRRARLGSGRKNGRSNAQNYSDFEQNLLSQVRTDHELSPILGEENLPDPVPQAGLRAGVHFRLFDDLRPMLHVDARMCALILVDRMAHAQTAQPALTLLCRSRNARQRQRGKNDGNNGELGALPH